MLSSRRLFLFSLKRLFFVFSILLIFFLILEALVRVTGVVKREGYGLGNFGTAKWFRFSTNADGFREEEIPLRKPAGEFRILIIGDSFAFGQGVDRQNTFPRRLEKTWRDRPPFPGMTVRIINASKLGWNIKEEAAFFFRRAFDYQPDLILLATIPNDSEFGQTYDHFHDRWITNTILWKSHLFRFVYVRWLWLSFEYLNPDQNVVSHLQRLWEPGTKELSTYTEYFQQMARDARRNGLVFLQVLFPFFHRLDDSYPLNSYTEQAMQVATRADVPCLDLFPIYRGMNPRDLIVSATDTHPNEAAHAIAAEAIGRFISDRMAYHPGDPSLPSSSK